jgi:hypothetical protein
MKATERYRSDYENYQPSQVFYQKSHRYDFSNEKFVVPWQLEENKNEKADAR